MKTRLNPRPTPAGSPKVSLDRRIEAAWADRWSQDMEATIRAFPELRVELGLPLWDLSGVELSSIDNGAVGANAQEAIRQSDVILLQASIYRAMGHFEETERLHLAASRLLASAGLSGSFRLHFERGLVHLVHGRYLTALEEFYSAARFTSQPLYQIIALTNAVLCTENAGISAEATLSEIDRLRKKALERYPVYRANENQLRAYRMRQHLRRGEAGAALAELPEGERWLTPGKLLSLDQSHYYALWIQSLPYQAGYRQLSREEAALLVRHPHALYQRGYLIRTLLGHTHTDDQGFMKLSERVDRAYLWCWMWLANPEEFPAERLMAAVNEVLARLELNALTVEDRYLLRNVLGWLGVADPSFKEKTRTVLRKLETASQEAYRLFDGEWAVIQLISAKVSGRELAYQDTLHYLERSPLVHSSEVHLGDMVRAIRGDASAKSTRLGRIALRLCERTGKSQEGTGRILVDLNTFTVEDRAAGRSVVSQPLAVALRLLRDERKVSCEDLCREAFGLHTYDPLIHAPKVFNLVARIRSLLGGGFALRVRSGVVLGEGDWDRVVFREINELSRLLRGDSSGLDLHRPRMSGRIEEGNAITLLLRDHGRTGFFDRAGAERTLAVSRSTSSRILERLVSEGKIERNGSGRSTHYRFKFSSSERITA